MESSLNSKVAALANIFQQDDRNHGTNKDPTRTDNYEKDGGLKCFKNKHSVNIRRTSSQVARFSSAKKVFESRDKESLIKERLNLSHNEVVVKTPEPQRMTLANTLPQR